MLLMHCFVLYFRSASTVSGRPGESTVRGRPGGVWYLCDCRPQHVLLRAASWMQSHERYREIDSDLCLQCLRLVKQRTYKNVLSSLGRFFRISHFKH